MESEHPKRRGCFEHISCKTEKLGRNANGSGNRYKEF
jgi:hypothetical protein